MNVRGHSRIAECAQQDGVEIAFEHREAIGRHSNTIREIAIGAPVEMGQLNVGARGVNNVYSLTNDLGADTIPGDHCDSLLLAHGLEGYQLASHLSFHALDGGRASR